LSAYYAAVCLSPYYKYYCDNSWANKPEWLTAAKADFQRLWCTYRPQQLRPRPKTTTNSIDDMIGAFVRRISGSSGGGEASDDEFERWKATEPLWSKEQYHGNGHPV
jgi:hypothetical protein